MQAIEVVGKREQNSRSGREWFCVFGRGGGRDIWRRGERREGKMQETARG
jgi:hypothetical protein